jgi:hypothetical protein
LDIAAKMMPALIQDEVIIGNHCVDKTLTVGTSPLNSSTPWVRILIGLPSIS